MSFSPENSNIMVNIAAKVVTYVIANEFIIQRQLLLFRYLLHSMRNKYFFKHTHLAASI